MLTTDSIEENRHRHDEIASGQSVYNYYRDYDPATGRYIQSDPVGLGGGLSTYVYVGSRPASATDPFGLTQCDIDAAVTISKAFYPKLNFGEGPPIADLPKDSGLAANASLRNQGPQTNIPGRDGLIHLNEKYLDCLSDEEAIDLLDSVIHESFHFTRPPALQVQPEFDHGYIVPEAVRKTDAASGAFLVNRAKCNCACR